MPAALLMCGFFDDEDGDEGLGESLRLARSLGLCERDDCPSCDPHCWPTTKTFALLGRSFESGSRGHIRAVS